MTTYLHVLPEGVRRLAERYLRFEDHEGDSSCLLYEDSAAQAWCELHAPLSAWRKICAAATLGDEQRVRATRYLAMLNKLCPHPRRHAPLRYFLVTLHAPGHSVPL